jgi:hypothetical protein
MSLVGQIQDFAVIKHRDFVTTHLKKWLELPLPRSRFHMVRGRKEFYPTEHVHEWMKMKVPYRRARKWAAKQAGIQTSVLVRLAT